MARLPSSLDKLNFGHFKERRAISAAACADEPVPPKSGQAHQWPQQERDARDQRAATARQYEKKKVFHAAIPFPLGSRRLSRRSVPVIFAEYICSKGGPTSGSAMELDAISPLESVLAIALLEAGQLEPEADGDLTMPV
ncbi:hypothetical protein V1294_000289 [Bradyrhizobium sp. AZCC 1678]|uniref:hypothetical protein n=1 Tax=Bradyrhizobium sp. AZCC 1678 TaxID=3117030 RepID=UPI002FEF44AC